MLNFNIASEMNADQKVPQLNAFSGLEEDMMFCDITAETDANSFFKSPDPFSFSEDVKLPPVASMTCTPVEMNDQQLTAGQSPIHLLDLDHVQQDMTFYPESTPSVHIKQEVPEIPSGCTEYGFDTQGQYHDTLMYSEQNQSDSLEVVINAAKEVIDTACVSLQISPDPWSWSVDQTKRWVMWQLQQSQLNVAEADMFLLSGAIMCQMSEADFTTRSMECGSTLFSQLEFWKNTSNLYNQTLPPQPTAYSENAYMSFQDAVPQPTPSVSPAPSTSSLDSTSSNSGSCAGFPAGNSVHLDILNQVFDNVAAAEKPVRHEHKQTIHLWQFLKELLVHPQSHASCIKWLDREKGIFKIEDSSRVAHLWGKRKNRPAMNYDKLSRSIRQYYKKGIIKKTEHSKRLVYQFCKPYLS